MVVIQKISIFIRQYISIRHKIKMFSAEFLLHFDIIEAQSILPCDLVGVWKMIDSLVFIQSFIKIRLTAATGPEEIPFVRFSVFEVVCFTDATHQFGIAFQYLVKEFTVLDVVAAASSLMVAVGRCWWSVHKELRPINVFKLDIFIDASAAFVLAGTNILGNWRIHHFKLSVLVEEVLRCARLSVLATRNKQGDIVVFDVAQ